MTPQRKLYAGIAVIVLLSFFFVGPKHNAISPLPVAKNVEIGQGIWTPTREMTTAQNAQHHFEKHGGEMGYKTAEEYVGAAIAFTTTPPKGTLQTRQMDGDTVFFHPPSGIFAVKTKDGLLRTYFRRDDNLRGYKSNMQYFNEQAKRR